jgi:hypothetical protein
MDNLNYRIWAYLVYNSSKLSALSNQLIDRDVVRPKNINVPRIIKKSYSEFDLKKYLIFMVINYLF